MIPRWLQDLSSEHTNLKLFGFYVSCLRRLQWDNVVEFLPFLVCFISFRHSLVARNRSTIRLALGCLHDGADINIWSSREVTSLVWFVYELICESLRSKCHSFHLPLHSLSLGDWTGYNTQNTDSVSYGESRLFHQVMLVGGWHGRCAIFSLNTLFYASFHVKNIGPTHSFLPFSMTALLAFVLTFFTIEAFAFWKRVSLSRT